MYVYITIKCHHLPHIERFKLHCTGTPSMPQALEQQVS